MPRPQPTGLRDGLRLGWRHWRRDLRAGTLRLLMLSVMLAVAAVSAVGFLSDRIQSALWRDARQLLGGDLVVVSDQPLPAAFDEQARTLGLQVNQNLSFPTMARSLAGPDAETLLVALKAVREGYPLRGQLWLRTDTQTPATPAAGQVPAPGQAWVDPGLLASLDLKLGDQITIALERNRDELACVLAEPILGDAGIIPPVPGFLEGLRRICDENDVVLIFDEIITGFRVSLGGAQELYGVIPDITCIAKAVGGGTPGAAAFGGKVDELVPGPVAARFREIFPNGRPGAPLIPSE